MSAGAKHCADLAGTFAGQEYAPASSPKPAAGCSLIEAAAEHERERIEQQQHATLSLIPFLVVMRDALYGDD